MTIQTVPAEDGHPDSTRPPFLDTTRPPDGILVVQDGKAGLFPPAAFATATALADEARSRENTDDRLQKQIDALKAPLIQSFTATNVQDCDRIVFPQPFADDDIQIFITPETPSSTGSWYPPACGYNQKDRYSFGLTRFFADGTPKTSAGTISVLAIGKRP